MQRIKPSTDRRIRVRSTEDTTIIISDIIGSVLSNWYWYVFSALVFSIVTYLYMAKKPNIYQRQAVMLVKEDSQSGSSSRRSAISTDALLSLNGVLSGASVKNELYILQSYMLCQEVARDLQLDVTYTLKKPLRTVSLYKERPFTIQFLQTDAPEATFSIVPLSKTEYKLLTVSCKKKKYELDRVCRFGEKVSTPAGDIMLIPEKTLTKTYFDEKIDVNHLSIDNATVMVCNSVTTEEIDKESSLVRIICSDTNVDRACDILNGLLQAYKRSIIEDKNLVAKSTADFVNERLRLISEELSDVDSELADFKQRNNLVDFKENTQAFLQQSNQARQRTIQLETQLGAIDYLTSYLKDTSKGNVLIPSLGGVADMGISQQIANYNQTMLQRNRLAANANEQTTAVRELDESLTQMRTAVIASVEGFRASLQVQVDQARREENQLLGGLSTVPQKERLGLDIIRQQAIKETLYTYLLNKREETTLQLAINDANIRVVERPFGNPQPIGPHRKRALALALLLGLAIPFVISRLKSLLDVKVRGRSDIESLTTIPVLGEIPHRRSSTIVSESDILVKSNRNDSVNEAFRMLRFSMSFISKDARVIMFTSTIPGEGKTFVSRNFTETLALTGKRAILVDTDIRKRTQSKLTASTTNEGLTSFLSGAVDTIDDLIVRNAQGSHFDFLPAGLTPPNPAELLMSNRLEELISLLKQRYDYIVVDNVPAQAVADACIVNRVADITLYVIREGIVDRRSLPEIERLYEEKKFNNLAIVVNDAHIQNGHYGYGYYYRTKSHKSMFSFLRKQH